MKKDIPDYSQIQKKSERTSVLSGVMRSALLLSSTEFVSAFRFSSATRSIDTVHGSQEIRFFVSSIGVLVQKWKRDVRFHEYFGPFTATRISAAGTLIYCISDEHEWLRENINEHAKYPITNTMPHVLCHLCDVSNAS